MNDTILLRRDTAANWTAANPILLAGEEGLEIDTKRKKMGDGVTPWNSLDYNKLEGIADSTGTSHNLAISQAAASEAIGNVQDNVDNLDGKVDDMKTEIDGDISTLNDKVNALIVGAKLSLTNTWSVCYLRVAKALKLVATMSGVTPNTIAILEGSTTLASAENQASLTYENTVTLTSLSKAYRAQAIYNGGTFNANLTVYARNPIFAGFGASADSVINVEANKITPKLSATGTYAKTNSIGDGVYFYLLVPTDVTSPSSFTMGGAPFVMTNIGQTSFTVNGESVTYNVFQSGATYNQGAEVNIVAA